MKKLYAALTAAVLFACATPAPAQQTLIVTTGAEKGSTYTQMFSELRDACQSPVLSLRQVNSTGAVENMDRLVANKVNAGIVQTDIIWLRGKSDNLSNIKTLVTLHPEEVHLVVKASGWRGRPSDFFRTVQPRSIEDLKGWKVAAGGGSFITARVISQLSKVEFDVVQAKDGNDAIGMVTNGEAQAALLVGGAPLGSLSGLDASYRLLPLTDDVIERLAQVYVPAKVSYSNLNSSGVKTVATEALLVTQDYKSAGFTKSLTALRTCLAKSIDDLREGTGLHPKWKLVDVANRGKWPGYWEAR